MFGNPIFAFGSGRSGTTLLAKLIDSSRNILYRHEPDKAQPLNSMPYLPEEIEYEQHLEQSRIYLEQLTKVRAPACSTKPPIFDKNFRGGLETKLLRYLVPVYRGLDKAHVPLKVPDFISNGEPRVLIKSVSSICRAPMFSRAVPEMKFIHIIRHPGAVLASLLTGIENNSMRKYDFLDSVAKLSIASNYPLSYEYLSNASFEEKSVYVWMLQNDKVHMEMKDSGNYLLVSYEDLCIDMQDRVMEMCDFAGIDFDDQMREFIRMISNVNNESGYFSVMKNPTSSMAKWENKIDDKIKHKIIAMTETSEVGRIALEKYRLATEKMKQKA